MICPEIGTRVVKQICLTFLATIRYVIYTMVNATYVSYVCLHSIAHGIRHTVPVHLARPVRMASFFCSTRRAVKFQVEVSNPIDAASYSFAECSCCEDFPH